MGRLLVSPMTPHEFRSSDRPYTCRTCGENIREHALNDEVREYLDRPTEPTIASVPPQFYCVAPGCRHYAVFNGSTCPCCQHEESAEPTRGGSIYKKLQPEPALPKGEADGLRSRSVVRRLVAQGASDVLIEELETLRKENASLVERIRTAEAEFADYEDKLERAMSAIGGERDQHKLTIKQQSANWNNEVEQLRAQVASAEDERDNWMRAAGRTVLEIEESLLLEKMRLEQKVATLEAELAHEKGLYDSLMDHHEATMQALDRNKAQVASLEGQLATLKYDMADQYNYVVALEAITAEFDKSKEGGACYNPHHTH